ncbi:MAG: pal [Rickettsiaceae bacterium]|jgi:peptidoglycan-associated lipoprotein|nr:pal [Rickettsiaceae bacterium]
MKKILLMALLAISISSCAGKKFDFDDSLDDEAAMTEQKPVEVPQNTQNFEAVESKAAAEAVNTQAQAAIEQVEVADRVFFDLDSSALTDSAKKVLDNQVAWLKSDSSIKITLEGHCDERGTREYNIALGEKRANAVKNYLTSNGVESSRIKTISYGKERPAFVGEGEEIWSKNRRAVTVMEESKK